MSLQRIASLLLAAALCLAAGPLVPAEASGGDFFIDQGVLVRYVGAGGDVRVPDGVRVIGDAAFARSSVRSVVLPESCTAIRGEAFLECGNLSAIRIPGSVQTIGWRAFQFCTALTSAVLEEGVRELDSSAFAWCTALERVSLPDSLDKVGYRAFYATPWLAGQEGAFVTAGSGVLLAYRGADADVTVPDGVRSIGGGVFAPELDINGFPVDGAPALRSVTLPDSLRRIDEQAFMGCTALESVRLPQGLLSIGSYAFSGCTALEELRLPDSLVVIGTGAFQDCRALASVRLPKRLQQVGRYSFMGCTRMTGFALDPANPYLLEDDGCLYSADARTLLMVPAGRQSALEVPAGVSRVEAGAAAGCSSLPALTLPEGCREIGVDAFSGCGALARVSLPSTLGYIGKSAFAGCGALSSLDLPAGVELDCTVFAGCSGLGQVRFWGDCVISGSSTAFVDVEATLRYPAGNASWAARRGTPSGLTLAEWTPPAYPQVPSARSLRARADGGGEGYVTVTRSDALVSIDGTRTVLPAYLVRDAAGGGTNYLAVRDVAAALSGTRRQFAVDWDGARQSVVLRTGAPYASAAPYAPLPAGDHAAQACRAGLLVDRVELSLSAVLLPGEAGGSYCFKLRELGDALGFAVDWDGESGCILIRTA